MRIWIFPKNPFWDRSSVMVILFRNIRIIYNTNKRKMNKRFQHEKCVWQRGVTPNGWRYGKFAVGSFRSHLIRFKRTAIITNCVYLSAAESVRVRTTNEKKKPDTFFTVVFSGRALWIVRVNWLSEASFARLYIIICAGGISSASLPLHRYTLETTVDTTTKLARSVRVCACVYRVHIGMCVCVPHCAILLWITLRSVYTARTRTWLHITDRVKVFLFIDFF